MAVTVATPKDYWISQQALSITLNALGEPNRIQASVASGAAILCYIKGVKPASSGSEYAKNGDGLEYDNGHNYRRWPITISPTYFNSDTEKYLYVAIPRSATIGTDAVVVFPSVKLDIYGYSIKLVPVKDAEGKMHDKDGNETDDPTKAVKEEQQDKLVGSEDYFYIWLQGIISEPTLIEGVLQRQWSPLVDCGTLSTDEAISTLDTDWYKYNTVDQVVHFLKQIAMDQGASFINLILNNKELIDVATKALTTPVDSDKMVATPGYVKNFYLSRVTDDIAKGHIRFDGGLSFMDKLFSIDNSGNPAVKGFLDGRGIYMDANEGLIQTDGLEVRGFMRVMELIINRLQLMESDYSFTEGCEVEHIDYVDNGQRLKLTMHKEHDNDYAPFYCGDILYAKVNNLLPRGTVPPEGHIETKHGSYYTVWLIVRKVNYSDNTMIVEICKSLDSTGAAYVPGAHNFTFYGTSLRDRRFNDEPAAALQYEMDITAAEALGNNVVLAVSGPTLGTGGFDTNITVTRHGNIADNIDPDTGLPDPSGQIKRSQEGRQQSWVLSTTDQRLTYYWRVSSPILRSDNIAMCLGILPTMLDDDGILPSTRDKSMPSLYINTIFYENSHHIYYPSRIVKEDRGEWVEPDPTATPPQPSVVYNGPSGTYEPDGTLTDENIAAEVSAGHISEKRAAAAKIVRTWGGTYTTGQTIFEPYHFESMTKVEWLTQRLSSAWNTGNNRLTDLQLYIKIIIEWHHDLETSRTWNNGILWECLVDGTTHEPMWNNADWMAVSGDNIFHCEILSSAGSTFHNGNVDTVLSMSVFYGQEDICEQVKYPIRAVTWTRMTGWDDVNKTFVQTPADRNWQPNYTDGGHLSVLLLRHDMGSGWMSEYRRAMIVCSIDNGEEEPLTAARRIL